MRPKKQKTSAHLRAAVVVLALGRNLGWFTLALRTGTALNTRMLRSILHAPLSFFHTTPTGRILNVFSKDQGSVDEQLPAVRPPCLCASVAVDSLLRRVVLPCGRNSPGKQQNCTAQVHIKTASRLVCLTGEYARF